MPPNLLGGPPMPPNLLGGPPPLNLLGKGGPPNLFMPMVAQAVKKAKEKKKPRIPLRGLMWTIVPSANVKETLWEEIDDEKVDLDIDFLEKEFAAKKPATSVPGGNDPKPILERVKVKFYFSIYLLLKYIYRSAFFPLRRPRTWKSSSGSSKCPTPVSATP